MTTYTATISDPNDPNAMPMWESFDHATAAEAFGAAQIHVRAAQPDDQFVDHGHGVWFIRAGGDARGAHVATLRIEPTDDPHPAPATASAPT